MFQDVVISMVPTNLSWVCVLFASMLPLIEIRGAIPFGMSSVFAENPLSLWQVCLISFVGSTISALFVLLILKLIIKLSTKNRKFNEVYKKFKLWLDKKFFNIKNKNTMQKTTTRKWLILMLFTGLPVPFSGCWTACLLAVFFGLKIFPAISAIVVGNFVAVLLVSLFCTVFIDFVDLVLVVFVAITILFILFELLKLVFTLLNKKTSKEKQNL